MKKDILSFTEHDTSFICTDMILSVNNNEHVLYYNCIEEILQDNTSLYYVPFHRLKFPVETNVRTDITSSDSSTSCKNICSLYGSYRPVLYHYQDITGYKTLYNKILQHDGIKGILYKIEFIKAFIGSAYPPYRKISSKYTDALDIIYKCYMYFLDKTITKEKFMQIYKTLQGVGGYSFFETFITNNGYKFNSNPALEQIYDSI